MDVFIQIHYTTDGFCSYTLQLQFLCNYCLALEKLFVFNVSHTDGFNTYKYAGFLTYTYISVSELMKLLLWMARFQLHCVCTVLSSVILHSASNCTIASDDSIHSRYLKLTLLMRSNQKHHLHHGAQSRAGHDPHTAQGMHITQWQNLKRSSTPSELSQQLASNFRWFWGWDAYAGVTVCLYQVNPFLYALTFPCWKYWSQHIWLKLPELSVCSKGMATNVQQKWYGISAFSPPNDLSSLSSSLQVFKVITH